MCKNKAIRKICSIVLVFTLIFTQAAVIPAYAEGSDRPFRLLEIEIHRGDTLSRFAQRYLNDPSRWPELLQYNKIPSGDPNLILPGHTLMVPMDLVRDEIADLVYLQNNVRVRRKESPSWAGVGLYERLFPDDGIRTGSNSFAQLQYLTGGGVNINENSLVFLRPERDRDNVVKLEVGELRARDVKVLTASAIIDPGEGSDYIAKVDEDQTTTLSVYRGKVDFISSGQLVAVSEGFMSRAEFNRPPSRPIQLPDPPEFKASGDVIQGDAGFSGRFDAAGIVKSLDQSRPAYAGGRDPVTGVHIQLARDEEFTRMVIDSVVDKSRPDEWKENLADGTYWWRAALVTESGVRGQFSSPVIHEVDTQPPVLRIDSPKEGGEVRSRVVSITGRTRPGVSITVNERPARIDAEGNFVSAVNVRFGENEVLLKAVDERRRVTERKLVFQGHPVDEEQAPQNIFALIGIGVSVLSVIIIILSVI